MTRLIETGAALPEDPSLGCGYFLFRTGDGDPFRVACEIHDQRYANHEAAIGEIFTREQADSEFLHSMLETAGESWMLRAKAYGYYVIVKAFGGLIW